MRLTGVILGIITFKDLAKGEILHEKSFVYSVFTTLSKLILSNKLLLGEHKINFSDKFKLKLVLTYHFRFFVKIL